jgi:simple sugar transport system permease protein
MITGFFADGIYQMIFLFMAGTIIPMSGAFVLSTGMGLRNTIDLMKKNDAGEVIGIGKAMDKIIEVPFFYVVMVIAVAMIAYYVIRMKKQDAEEINKNKTIFGIGLGAALFIFSNIIMFTTILPHKYNLLKTINMSVFTALVVIGFAAFNVVFLNTKLGQTLKTVGQDKHIAEVSGIKVNKVRELAIMLSTLFAAWGQIIFIQNLGILNTYGSHKQIALFAVAALLIGGASVSKATIGQAFLGVLLFHTLFIVSPKAGLNLFGDAQLGEFFRTFVAYGVIGVSLGLHAWKTLIMKRTE